jgi:hypothetical protein
MNPWPTSRTAPLLEFGRRAFTAARGGHRFGWNSGESDMREWLIIVAIALVVGYVVDEFWFHGVYFLTITNMFSQIIRHFR